jgi:hypothetical protein
MVCRRSALDHRVGAIGDILVQDLAKLLPLGSRIRPGAASNEPERQVGVAFTCRESCIKSLPTSGGAGYQRPEISSFCAVRFSARVTPSRRILADLSRRSLGRGVVRIYRGESERTRIQASATARCSFRQVVGICRRIVDVGDIRRPIVLYVADVGPELECVLPFRPAEVIGPVVNGNLEVARERS